MSARGAEPEHGVLHAAERVLGTLGPLVRGRGRGRGRGSGRLGLAVG